MDISSLSGSSSTQQQQTIQRANARLQSVIASIVSGQKNSQSGDDVAALSIAARLQSDVSGLREISTNLAQAGSLLQVADGGAGQIQSVLQQLQNLAQQAGNPTLNSDNRAQLNQQFKQLASQIDQLANSTSFGGKSLLDGSVGGNSSLSLDNLLSADGGNGDTGVLSIDSLSASALFGGQDLNLLSADGVKQAAQAINDALGKVTGTRADIGAFQQSVDFASANIDSANFNQQAALSTLSDTDFADASSQLAASNLQLNAALAITAQGNKLSPAILKLVD